MHGLISDQSSLLSLLRPFSELLLIIILSSGLGLLSAHSLYVVVDTSQASGLSLSVFAFVFDNLLEVLLHPLFCEELLCLSREMAIDDSLLNEHVHVRDWLWWIDLKQDKGLDTVFQQMMNASLTSSSFLLKSLGLSWLIGMALVAAFASSLL